MGSSIRPVVVLSLVALAGATPCAANNMVVNPTFSGGIAPWAGQPGGAAAFSTTDAVGAAASGSVKVTDTMGLTSVATVGQCVAITPGAHYRFRADLLFPTGQPTGQVEAFFYRLASSNCTGPVLDGGNGPIITLRQPSDQWQRMENGNLFANDPAAHSIFLELGVERTGTEGTTPIVANFDNVVVEPSPATGTCVPDGQSLCLSDFRFRVGIVWHTSQAAGIAMSNQLTDDSGTFTFFDPSNVEVVLKVIDACAFNQRFWVYAGGTTDQGVDITVVDTKTSLGKAYHNALGHPFTPILDSSALATCP